MFLRTKIFLGISLIVSIGAACYYFLGPYAPRNLPVMLVLGIILAFYAYIQYAFTPLDELLEAQSDFSGNPADMNEVEYIAKTLNHFIEKDKNDQIQRNKLLITNELLSHLNDTITEMIDGVGQGFLTFDMEGNCGSIYSKACISLLGTDPKGKYICDVLGIPASDHANINDIIEMIFMPSHALSVDDLFAFFPQEILRPDGTVVKLDYKAIEKKSGTVVKVVVIATDRTSEVEAKKMLDDEKTRAKTTIKIGQRRKDFIDFIKSFRGIISILSDPSQKIEVPKLKNSLHSLKGFAGVFGLRDVIMKIHDFETGLNQNKLEDILQHHTEELEKGLNDTIHIAGLILGDNFENEGEVRHIKLEKINEFIAKLKSDQKNEKLLEAFLNDIVATPITEIISGFESSMFDVSMDLGKKIAPIKIQSNISSIMVDNYTNMFNSFTHIFNNIVDHGIEAPDKRVAIGKTAEGNIKIDMFVRKESEDVNYLHITIEDDGGGINPEKIREKLKSLDPEGTWQEEPDQQVIQHIFDAGFSTKSEVSTLSGRGVGMDAVREQIQELGGEIRTESQVEMGTKFLIKVPYPYNNAAVQINTDGDIVR